MNVGAIGVYLLEASILLILFYIFNKLLLSRETLHRLNRFLWLAVVATSFILPLSIPQMTTSEIAQQITQIDPNIAIGNIEVIGAHESTTPSNNTASLILLIVAAIYCIGATGLLTHHLISYGSLIRLLYTHRNDVSTPSGFELYEQQLGVKQKVRYVVHNHDIAPFSWFNFVVVSHEDLAANGHEIVMHELSHVVQRHSYDVLLLNIATIILWFNPAVWLTKQAAQQVHEYCADESVISQGVNIKEYQLLLIRKAVGARLYTISNSLNHSNLKNRITMMLQKKSSPMAWAKCLYAIPTAIIATAIFASPALAETTKVITEVKITNYFDSNKIETPQIADPKEEQLSSIDASEIESAEIIKSATPPSPAEQNDKPAVYKAEQMPAFGDGGSLHDFRSWVMEQIKYPEDAAANKISGQVVASFVVDTNGSVVDIKCIKTPNESLYNELERILKSSPKWTPGVQDGKKIAVTYMLPIIFKID